MYTSARVKEILHDDLDAMIKTICNDADRDDIDALIDGVRRDALLLAHVLKRERREMENV